MYHQLLFAVPFLLATSMVAAHGGVIQYSIDGQRYDTQVSLAFLK